MSPPEAIAIDSFINFNTKLIIEHMLCFLSKAKQSKAKQSKAKQSKANGNRMKHGYCHPANQFWDTCVTLRRLSLVQANLPGAGLVTRRRTVQVSWREVVGPKVPQRPQHC